MAENNPTDLTSLALYSKALLASGMADKALRSTTAATLHIRSAPGAEPAAESKEAMSGAGRDPSMTNDRETTELGLPHVLAVRSRSLLAVWLKDVGGAAWPDVAFVDGASDDPDFQESMEAADSALRMAS